MKKEKICGIYKITNKVNGKVYIGQSVDIYCRWCSHKNTMKNKNKKEYDYPLYRAFRKYGVINFNFEVIHICEESELNDLEIKYISQYNSCTLDEEGYGYNQNHGGNNNIREIKLSDETKQKIANKLKQSMLGENNPMYGKHHTKNTRKLISEARKNNETTRTRKIICDSIEFLNAPKCADYYKVNIHTMVGWLNKVNKMPQKFIDLKLHYKDSPNEIYDVIEKKTKGQHYASKKVVCNNVLFESVIELSEYYDIKVYKTRDWLRGKVKTPKPFIDMNLHYATQDEIEQYRSITV